MIRRAARIILLAVLVTAPTLALGAEEYLLPNDPFEGARLFVSKGCVKCHAIRGEGGKIGPDLGRIRLGRSLLEVAGILWNHSPQMNLRMQALKIQRPKLTSTELANLIAFLYYLGYFDEPGNPADGKAVFESKGCMKCHSIRGKGGISGPNLSEPGKALSPISLAQAMWNHGPEMESLMKRIGIARPTFKEREIVDLFAYLQPPGRATAPAKGYLFPGDPKRGKKMFFDKGCIGCHSIKGEGGTGGPDLGQQKEGDLHRSLTSVAGVMWNHGPEMWGRMWKEGTPIPKFSGTEMADIIAYLYVSQYFDEPGDPLKGQGLFAEKSCINCHSIKGQGGKVGPDLALAPGLPSSPVELAATLWNHAPLMEKAMAERKISWPQFKGRELADILAYIASRRKS